MRLLSMVQMMRRFQLLLFSVGLLLFVGGMYRYIASLTFGSSIALWMFLLLLHSNRHTVPCMREIKSMWIVKYHLKLDLISNTPSIVCSPRGLVSHYFSDLV
jgi:hypothetical protein